MVEFKLHSLKRAIFERKLSKMSILQVELLTLQLLGKFIDLFKLLHTAGIWLNSTF